jgi:membrane protein
MIRRLIALLDRFPWFKSAREVAQFAYRRAREVRLQQVASSLTLTTVLSIVPLIAVALAVFTAFPLFGEYRDALQTLALKTLPAQIAETVLGYVGEFAAQAGRLTAAGLVFLAVSAVAMIMTVDHALNEIWQVRNRRPLWQRLLIYWAILTFGPLLVGASLTASSFLWAPSPDELRRVPWLARVALDYLPVVLTGFAYAALYVFVPNRPVRWRDALIGGFVAAILSELLKAGFAHYIARGSVRSIYGAFAVLPLFLLWMYLSWYVLLFGAAIAATLPRLRATRFADEVRAGNAFITALAMLRHLLAVTRSQPAVPLETLAADARTDLVDAERLLETMERLGYVRRLATPRRRGASSEWLLACDPQEQSLRPLFERYGVDPRNLLLALDSEGLGGLLTGWLQRDAWINAPLAVSLPRGIV